MREDGLYLYSFPDEASNGDYSFQMKEEEEALYPFPDEASQVKA